MKKIDLERHLKALGFWYDRDGGNHEIWTNGSHFESMPRHREVNENTAKKIIKRARKAHRDSKP